jgi:hypothetical protein
MIRQGHYTVTAQVCLGIAIGLLSKKSKKYLLIFLDLPLQKKLELPTKIS